MPENNGWRIRRTIKNTRYYETLPCIHFPAVFEAKNTTAPPGTPNFPIECLLRGLCCAGSSSQHPSLDTSGTSEAAKLLLLNAAEKNVGRIYLRSEGCVRPEYRAVLPFYSVRTSSSHGAAGMGRWCVWCVREKSPVWFFLKYICAHEYISGGTSITSRTVWIETGARARECLNDSPTALQVLVTGSIS